MSSDQTVVSTGGAEEKLGIPPTGTSIEASEANSVQQAVVEVDNDDDSYVRNIIRELGFDTGGGLVNATATNVKITSKAQEIDLLLKASSAAEASKVNNAEQVLVDVESGEEGDGDDDIENILQELGLEPRGKRGDTTAVKHPPPRPPPQ